MAKKDDKFVRNPDYYEFIAHESSSLGRILPFAVKVLLDRMPRPEYEKPCSSCHRRDHEEPNHGYITFLDVGCGVGNVISWMKGFWASRPSMGRPVTLHTQGIEYDKDIYKLVGRYFDIHNGDALEYPRYAGHNLIYYYHPIRNPELQAKLEEKIEQEAAPGTVLVSPMKRSRTYIAKHPNIVDVGSLAGHSPGVILLKV